MARGITRVQDERHLPKMVLLAGKEAMKAVEQVRGDFEAFGAAAELFTAAAALAEINDLHGVGACTAACAHRLSYFARLG
jgi:hypothetical protein